MFDIALVDTPYGLALDVAIIVTAVCWLLSVLTRDYSWVDRMWSIMPSVYCLIVAIDLDFESTRVNLMTGVALAWSIRLTLNLTLKGGYKVGHGDYRWIYLRNNLGALKFQVLNLTFTSCGQMAIVWLFTSPVHQAWQHVGQSLGWLDYLAAVLFLLLLTIETIGDIQMLRFQNNKKRLISEGADVEQPFITTGFFRFCRHPSHTCEVAMWLVFYLFAISAAGEIWHWTGIGGVVLLLMFQISTRFGEKLSLEKYPSYAGYQQAVPMFLPNPFRIWRSKTSAGSH